MYTPVINNNSTSLTVYINKFVDQQPITVTVEKGIKGDTGDVNPLMPILVAEAQAAANAAVAAASVANSYAQYAANVSVEVVSAIATVEALTAQTESNAQFVYTVSQEVQANSDSVYANSIYVVSLANIVFTDAQAVEANAAYVTSIANQVVANAAYTYSLSQATAGLAAFVTNVSNQVVANAQAVEANAVYVYGIAQSISSNSATILANAEAFSSNASNITSGTLAEPRLPYRMDQNVTTTSSVQFKDLQLSGTLTIGSNVNIISANNLYITDNMIYMNADAYNVNPDIGLAAGYYDGTYHHTGFFRDHTNGTWKVFDNYKPEPDDSIYIDQSNSTFHLANFMANTIFVGNNSVYGTITTTNFTGTANNATYAFGKTEANLNANSATYLGGNPSSYFAANSSLANYYLATNPAGYITSSDSANSATYLGGKLEANLNVNSAVYATNANSATYLNGFQSSYFAANSSIANYYLATNPAGYITSSASITGSANNTTYAFGKTEANLNVNSAVYSTNSSFAFTANNTVNLNGQPASYYSNATNIGTGTLAWERLPTVRVVSITDAISITVNADITDVATQINTQVAGTLTINAPTGTPRDGQKFILKIKSSAVQIFSWDVTFGGSRDMTLPSYTSGSSLIDYMGFQYDSISTKWHMLAKNFGF